MTTLEKIRAELHATAEMHEDGDYYLRDKWADEIIDKYADQEPCDDAVSRQAVLDALYDLFDVKNDRLVLIPWSASAIDARINALPSVQPKQIKVGHWVELDNPLDIGRRFRCSECGAIYIMGDETFRNFCQRCGSQNAEVKKGEISRMAAKSQHDTNDGDLNEG